VLTNFELNLQFQLNFIEFFIEFRPEFFKKLNKKMSNSGVIPAVRSVHRDRRKCVVEILLLMLCVGVSSARGNPADGCQVYASSGDRTDSNPQPVQIQCSLRFLNVIPGLDWMNISHPDQVSARSLSIECADPTAFPSALSRSSFAGFTQLESLSVDSCRLAELVDGSFRGLVGLRHLRIQTRNSEWPGTSLTLDANLLDDIRTLQSLDLAFNDIRTLPAESLCAMKQLTLLNLTSNRLTELGWIASSGCLSELKVLDLSYNQLAHLPARMLTSLTQLEELHVQGNNLLNIQDGSLDGLTSLRMLNLAGNRLSLLPPALLKSTPQLVEFYASANGLSVLAPGLFRNLTELLVLDLSDNQLASSALPPAALAGLQRLAVLSLHNNRIQRLDASLLSDLGNLQILRLDGNMLDTLPAGMLAAQRHLHTLILSRNRLVRISKDLLIRQAALAILALDNNLIESIDPEAFRNSVQLHDVNLSGNYLPAIPEALAPLTRLESLDLGENRIVGFDSGILGRMPELSSLRLLDNAVGNISRNTFAQLPGLRILNLSKNLIRQVEEGAFSRNPLLQAVRLDANQLTGIDGLFATLPHLAWLNVSDNALDHFDYSLIPKSLQWLDIHLNQVAELGNYFQLDESLALQTLDASFNRLTELTASMLPDSLQVVSLNDNLIRTVQPYAFFRKENLSRVDLYANHIQQLDQNALRISSGSSSSSSSKPLPEFYIGGNPFECDCHMEWIQRINTPDHLRQHPRVMDLEGVYCRLPHSRPQRSYVPLVEADSRHFVCTYQTHCFALCHCCDFDACDCEMTCPNDCTCYHDQSWSANVVDCSSGAHSTLPERIPMDVTELYLDGNHLPTLSSHKFIGRKNLRHLFLNNSRIQVIGNRTFNGLKGLRTLHLQDNRIRTLVGFELGDLESLRELYLHNNIITSLGNATFRSLRNLEILRLDGNRLVDFPVWNLIPASPYLIQLSLSANQWSCDCTFLTRFRNALQIAGSKVPDAAELLCVSNEIRPSGSSATMRVLRPERLRSSSNNTTGSNQVMEKEQEEEEEEDCIRPTPSATTIVQQRVIHDYLPLLVTTLVAFVCITCLVLVAFVYRDAIRIWCHARYGLRLVRPSGGLPEALDNAKLFDAFVSYSAKDDAFVQQMLATNLEYGSPSYKLCLQHRDCPSGGSSGSSYLSESIARAVESSRRTIMVISANFIKAEWCRFEYKSALHQLLKNRRKCLVVILIGDIRRKDLDPDLKLYLKTSTYLQWGQVGFWDRLRYALPDVPRSKNNRNHNHLPGRPLPPCTVTIPARTVTLNMSS